MGMFASISFWVVVRLITGFANAAMFVLGSITILAKLVAMGRMHLSGAF
jgi:hypothetical protein